MSSGMRGHCRQMPWAAYAPGFRNTKAGAPDHTLRAPRAPRAAPRCRTHLTSPRRGTRCARSATTACRAGLAPLAVALSAQHRVHGECASQVQVLATVRRPAACPAHRRNRRATAAPFWSSGLAGAPGAPRGQAGWLPAHYSFSCRTTGALRAGPWLLDVKLRSLNVLCSSGRGHLKAREKQTVVFSASGTVYNDFRPCRPSVTIVGDSSRLQASTQSPARPPRGWPCSPQTGSSSAR